MKSDPTENKGAHDEYGPPTHMRGVRMPFSTQVCCFKKWNTAGHANWASVCVGCHYSLLTPLFSVGSLIYSLYAQNCVPCL